jgi:hypothetical protein
MMPTSGHGIAMMIIAIVVAVVLGVWLSGYYDCC